MDLKPDEIGPGVDALYRQRMEDLGKDDPTTYRCLPPGPRQLFAPQGWVRIIQTPVLMIHNDADDAVPWYQGIEYFLGLRRLGKEVYFFSYAGEPHHPGRAQALR